MNSYYETKALLDQYLLFHYGLDVDQLPFEFGPSQSLNFPVKCVTQCVNRNYLPAEARALDLGCAVGRSTFELSRFCQTVIGIDTSRRFIRAAQHIQKQGSLEYTLLEEGSKHLKRLAKRPKGVNPDSVEFYCKDAMQYLKTKNTFHIVLAANLICRLAEPITFLEEVHSLVVQTGQLIIISPYSWKNEFTKASKRLKGNGSINSLKSILKKQFELERYFDMSFLMREHYRKYQWGVSQASLWIKK